MTAPRLIRLVPTGVVFQGVECVEPQEVEPLTVAQIMELYNEPRSDAEMIEFARAIEQAHGIGRRFDA